MADYFPNSTKSLPVKKLLNAAVEILHSVGIPIERQTQRRLERMAVCFLAVAGVIDSWQLAQGLEQKRHLKTRDVINFVNQYFEENISSGSYDDIRRKDLRLLVLAGLVINSGDKFHAMRSIDKGFRASSNRFICRPKRLRRVNSKKSIHKIMLAFQGSTAPIISGLFHL